MGGVYGASIPQGPGSAGGSGSNPAVGVPGQPAPAFAEEVAGVDVNGDLQPILVRPTREVVVDSDTLATEATVATLATEATVATLATEATVATLATEASLAAFSAKTAAGLVDVPYDYVGISYVGATTDIDTVLFKTGGAAGTVVATLTLGYDGTPRLTSVTKT